MLSWVQQWKSKIDFLILSLHDGHEYVKYPAKVQVEFYKKLVQAGVDVLWGSHPHVLQPWSWVKTNRGKRIILFSMGNFLTQQNFKAEQPFVPLCLLGDGALLTITVEKKGNTFTIGQVKIFLTNNYNDPDKGFVVRPTEVLASSAPGLWKNYFRQRLRVQEAWSQPWQSH